MTLRRRRDGQWMAENMQAEWSVGEIVNGGGEVDGGGARWGGCSILTVEAGRTQKGGGW